MCIVYTQVTLTCYTISSTSATTQEIQMSQTIHRCTMTPATSVLSLVTTGKSSTVQKNIMSFAKKVWHYNDIKWWKDSDTNVAANNVKWYNAIGHMRELTLYVFIFARKLCICLCLSTNCRHGYNNSLVCVIRLFCIFLYYCVCSVMYFIVHAEFVRIKLMMNATRLHKVVTKIAIYLFIYLFI